MPVRSANAQWNGNLLDGSGTVKLGSGAYEGPYSFKSRMEDGTGTNPEELIGAAHAGCFSMALAAGLSAAGHAPKYVKTSARVHFDKDGGGFSITKIELDTEASVPGLDAAGFQKAAEDAKKGCPVSKALTGTEIVLNAKLA
jgi:osmotically inducible protein OsmC